MEKRIRKKLTRIVGKPNALWDRTGRVGYAYDATNRMHIPDGVLFPADAGEISEILKLANRHGFPVVPRGAGSGFSGGAVPVFGGIVLSLERMNRILRIDPENLIAVVEPGVVTGDLQREAAAYGLLFPPDPASIEFCTIGGNVAECAGGMRALKYGVTRDYVLGLEVVLPTGELVRTGSRTVKSVVGYDLTRLIVGSEGTLCVVTQIVLKLIPLPEARAVVRAFFPTLEEAALAVSGILEARVLPSAMEIVDRASLDCISQTCPVAFHPDTQALLLIEVDGPEGSIEGLAQRVQGICARYNALSAESSRDPSEADALWALRRSISPSLAKIRPHRLNEDIVVPRGRLPEAIREIQNIARNHDVIIATFGHAGDGNLHVSILYDRADLGEASRAERAVEAVMRTAVGLGGSLSGEHGIGTAKSGFLQLELDGGAMELMSKIKSVMDPKGIMNPGKIFPGTAFSGGSSSTNSGKGE